MDIQSAKLVIHAAAQADDTVIMEGLHGIGKSQAVKQFAAEYGYHLEELFLSQQEVGDLIGNPKTIEVDGEFITIWSKPIWLDRIYKNAEQGIPSVVFLDEINRAPNDVRQSALQLVLERQIHEHILPTVNGQRTMIVAAINPADQYQVDELDPALLDRFLHVHVEADAPAFLKWGRKTGVNSIVLDFITEYPDRLHWMPQDGGVGATPRSWAKLGDFMDNVNSIQDEILFQIMKGKIGVEIASQFYSFFKNYVDVVKMEDIEKIVEENVDSFESIEDLAELISDRMSKAEAVQKMEMARNLANKHMPTDNIIVFLTYLYSLEIEIVVSFLKGYRKDEPEMYKKLAKVDTEINNKALFKRIVAASERE